MNTMQNSYTLLWALTALSLSVAYSQEVADSDSKKNGSEQIALTSALFELTGAMSPDKEAFSALLRKGTDPNAFHADGKSALLEVVLKADTRIKGGPLDKDESMEWLEIAKLLLDSGANPSEGGKPDADAEFTPLMAAAAHDLNEAVRLLLRYKPDVNAQEETGLTAMFFAARENNVDVLRMLVDAGADVNAGTDHRPLHIAATCGNREAVAFLLASKADVNVKTRKGNTPAQEAQELLTSRIDSPVEYAYEIKHLNAVLELLRKQGEKQSGQSTPNHAESKFVE